MMQHGNDMFGLAETLESEGRMIQTLTDRDDLAQVQAAAIVAAVPLAPVPPAASVECPECGGEHLDNEDCACSRLCGANCRGQVHGKDGAA
ncbi:MAG: hypothetical protein PHU85_00250 [Phycisphaerae bacterium]|nr:hypothetical protein [Phycisphaerae bacterium]